MGMKKYIIIESGIEVTLQHYGYDIVIVEHSNGHQELLTPNAIGLPNRTRYNPSTRKYYKN